MNWIELLVTIVCSMLASSGLWAYIQKKKDKNDATTRLVLGLAHDRIMSLGMEYIDRGWITQDEYENLHDYLYLPYAENGGNGSASRTMAVVDTLPIRSLHVDTKVEG